MVKNEEKYLEQCLQGIQPILKALDSELIIVDTGSTDSTVEIARRYTDKVYFHQWNNNFGEMRNVVLSYAKGEWFFSLDADEVLEDTTGVIEFFKSKKRKKYNAAFIAMNNIMEENNQENYGLFHALRFFKRDKDFHFKGIIHEQPQAKGLVAMIPGEIIHYGYMNDDKELMEYKYKRNVELIEKVLEKEPDNIYHLFQLSQSYSMYGEKKAALEPIVKAYQLAQAQDLGKHMYILNHLASIYFQNKLYKEAEEVCLEAMGLKEGYIDFYYFKGMSQFELGKTQEAIVSLEEYLELLAKHRENIGVVDLGISIKTVQKYEMVYLVLCKLYSKNGDYNKALEYGNLIENEQNIKMVIPHFIDIYIKKNQIYEIKNLYEQWLDNENMSKLVLGAIESARINLSPEEKNQLAEMFGEEQSLYGLLNKVRIHKSEKDLYGTEILYRTKDGEFNNLENYYGELLYYLIKHSLPWLESLATVKDFKIVGFMSYLIHNHREFQTDLLMDLKQRQEINDATDKNTLRILTTVYGTLLRVGDLKETEYENVFKTYLEIGINFIQLCYNPEIINQEKVAWARTNGDAFLLYMTRAEQVKEEKASYIKYLRLALQQDETMKRGIEFLLDEVQKSIDMPQNQELEEHKKIVLDSIEDALNAGELGAAKVLIKEYENIVGMDARICSAKAVVLMVEQRLDEAKEILLKGLIIEKTNSDLLYNMGYLHELKNEIEEAVRNYQLSYSYSKDISFREEIKQVLIRLGEMQNDSLLSLESPDCFNIPRVTVVIPTYNQKEFLEETIESVLEQDYPNLEILVGDDCSADGTEEMMKKYKNHQKIKYLRQEYNLGAGNNSSNLLKNHVNSKYAMILNHDDYLIKNDYISSAVKIMSEEPNISFVWANSLIKDEKSGQVGKTLFEIPKITSGLEYFVNYETKDFPHITGTLTTVFDFQKLRKSNFGNEKSYSRDTFLHLKLMLEGDVGFINDHVAVYRVHSQSISFNMPLEADTSTIHEFETMKEAIVNQGVFSNNRMQNWLENRVFSYVIWRFQTLWNQKRLKDAINILVSIYSAYPRAYNSILNTVFKDKVL